MTQITITATTRGEAVDTCTKLREAHGQRVDFGLPKEQNGLIIITGYFATDQQLQAMIETGERPDLNAMR